MKYHNFFRGFISCRNLNHNRLSIVRIMGETPKVRKLGRSVTFRSAVENALLWSNKTSFTLNISPTQGRTRGGPRPPPPSKRAPPERLMGGIHGGGSFNITSACISLPQVRHSGVPRGDSSPLAPLGVPKIQN